MKRKLLLGIAGLVGGLLLFIGANSLGETLMGNTAQPVRVNYTSPISFVSPVKATTTYGPEELVNGNLETWVSSTQPADWTFTDFSLGGSGATINQSSTTTGPSSTYSARLENNGDGSAYAILSQGYDCIIGETYGVGGYFMSDTASTSVGFMLQNEPTYASTTQIWSAASSTWINFNPSTDQPDIKGEAVSSTFFQTGAIFTCPGSGHVTISILPLEDQGQGAGKVLYVDDVVSYAFYYPADITLMDFTNPSDSARMEVGDYTWRMRTTGGTPFNWFYQDGFGKFGTEMTQFDFTTKPMLVTSSAYAYPNAAMSNERAYGIVGDPIQNINLTQTGSTTLFTIPDGYSLLDPMVKLVLTSVSGDTFTKAVVSAGCAFGGYLDVSDNSLITLNNLVFPKQAINLVGNSAQRYTRFLSGDDPTEQEIVLSVSTASGATTYVVTAYLFGTLIPN